MTTFAARKAERIANAGKTISYEVWSDHYAFAQVKLGSFKSKKAADKFANEQIGSFVGITAALRTFCGLLPRNVSAPVTINCEIRRTV